MDCEKSSQDLESTSLIPHRKEGGFCPEDQHRYINRRTRSCWYLHLIFFIVNLIFLTTNVLHYEWWEGEEIYSPANEAISYETLTFNMSLFDKNPFNGDPRPEQAAAWEELVDHQPLALTAAELNKLNRTSIELPGNRYLGVTGMFHQLHCLNYIREYIYSDYYNIEEEPATIKQHVAHCIDSLRQVIQCHGDTSILTYSWRPDFHLPWPDFQITKRCRSFDAIRAWADARRPHDFEALEFVNPILDPSWDGHPPTSKEGATELVSGTRLNPKIQADLKSQHKSY